MASSSSPIKGWALVLSLLAAGTLAQTNCVLNVPANPLTAQGLATPYTVSGCNQIDFANQGSFVEAVIFDPAAGTFQVYNPLVVNQGSKVGVDFIAPVPVTVPQGATVGIWFGTNAVTLTLTGDTNGCVNGLGGSIFGQFAHCNGDVFMKTAEAAVAAGTVKVPPPGTAAVGGQQCPTTRDFRVVDMDQSDNVDSTYLLINGKVLAQNTPANNKNNPGAEELTNGSDNALINDFIAPALGCTPFQNPSLTAPTGMSGSLATNELQANFFPPAGGPALVPMNDDFAFINNNGKITQSLAKTNLYRAGVGQPQAQTAANASGTPYCKSYAASGIFIAQNQNLFQGKTSPAANVATNLFTFLAQRFSVAFGPVPSLGCTTIFGVQNPVTLTTNGQGIVTNAVINTQVLSSILNGQTQPTGTAATGTAATTSVAATTKPTTGTQQQKNKGMNNVVPNQAGGTSPSVAPNAMAASQTAASSTAAVQTAVSQVQQATVVSSVTAATATAVAGAATATAAGQVASVSACTAASSAVGAGKGKVNTTLATVKTTPAAMATVVSQTAAAAASTTATAAGAVASSGLAGGKMNHNGQKGQKGQKGQNGQAGQAATQAGAQTGQTGAQSGGQTNTQAAAQTAQIGAQTGAQTAQTGAQTGVQTGQTGGKAGGKKGGKNGGQTGNQTGSQTGAQTGGQTSTQAAAQTAQTGTQTAAQTGNQTGVQTVAQAVAQTDDQTGAQTCPQTDSQIASQNDAQSSTQAAAQTTQTGAQNDGQTGSQAGQNGRNGFIRRHPRSFLIN